MDKKILKGKNGAYFFVEGASFLLKKGKFSETYLGAEVSSGKKVIVKKLVSLSNRQSSEILKRSLREMQFDVEHPQISKVTDIIETEKAVYLVRPYFEGVDLRRWIRNQPEENRENAAIKVGIGILSLLEHIHQHQIIHCDIRPDNIIVNQLEDQINVYLIDLGLAVHINSIPKEKAPFSMIYSPPEQVLNLSVLICPSTDLYSLGVTLYELASGKRPYNHPNPEIGINLQLTQLLQETKLISKPFYKLLLKSTTKNSFPLPPSKYDKMVLTKMVREGIQKRFKSAKEMRQALEEVLKQKELPKQPFYKRWFK